MESVLKMCERFGPFIKEAHFFFHVRTPWGAFLLHLFSFLFLPNLFLRCSIPKKCIIGYHYIKNLLLITV